MAGILQRPILVGGLGLSVAFALWEGLDKSGAGELGEWGLLGLLAVGTGAWLFKPRAPELDLTPLPATIDRAASLLAISRTKAVLSQLEAEIANSNGDNTEANRHLESLTQQLDALTPALDRQSVSIAVAGGQAVGKTALIEVLKSSDLGQNLQVSFVEVPALFTRDAADADSTLYTADLVLFVVAGDITDPEFDAVQQCIDARQRVVVVWNKQDRCLSSDRPDMLQQIRSRLKSLLNSEDAIAIAAAPSPIKVMRHQADNTVQESLEPQSADISALTARLSPVLATETPQLICASVLRSAEALKQDAKNYLNQIRLDRSLPIITQYQWVSAAAAIANPFPALDLLATAAANAQMIVDLGNIYQQKVSLDKAKVAAANLGELLLKLGLVELSTQTVSAILKTNAVTYLAGGAVQGISAAYLTRIVGLSLIEYFQQQDIEIAEAKSWNWDTFGAILKQVFQQNQRADFARSFVKQAIDRLSPKLVSVNKAAIVREL
ncbi:MAG: DUF697 domain-containing protein [Geitlerinemataceae cyanobacterium]